MGARDRSPVYEDSSGDGAPGLEDLLHAVGKGDRGAFEELYEVLAPRVFGLVLRVLRDRAHSEEVAQEALVEVWRSAARYEPDKGSVMAWVLTIAHRRAIDRVRSAQAGADREERAARLEPHRCFDEVSELVVGRLEGERLRRCLDGLPRCSVSRSLSPTTAATPIGRSPNWSRHRWGRSRHECAMG